MATDPSRSRQNLPSTVPSDVLWRQGLCFPLSLFVVSLLRSVTGRHESTSFQRPVFQFQKKLSRAMGGSYRSLPTRTATSSVRDHEESGGNSNEGVYLDADTYLQAEDTLLRADGSLDMNKNRDTQRRSSTSDPFYTPMASAPFDPPVQPIKSSMYQAAAKGIFSPAPSYSYSNDDDDDTRTGTNEQLSKSQEQISDEEKLYQTVTDIEAGKQTTNAEALHRQVFAEEQAFLQQSEEFRNSLSTDEETPMAQKRRTNFEQHNEKVLDGLLMELDKMERSAMSRDEAMGQARNSSLSANSKTKDVVCPMCGLRVTPDMLRRAKVKEVATGEEEATKSNPLMCQSCYRQQLQTVNEARIRLGGGAFAGSSSAKRFNNNQWGGGKRYKGRRKNNARGDRNGGGGSVQGISTSLLFNVPKGYGPKQKRETAQKNFK